MSLKPILNSPLDRPAKTIDDVAADVHQQVAVALHDTAARIAQFTSEIEDIRRSIDALTTHRAALIAWLEQNPTQGERLVRELGISDSDAPEAAASAERLARG